MIAGDHCGRLCRHCLALTVVDQRRQAIAHQLKRSITIVVALMAFFLGMCTLFFLSKFFQFALGFVAGESTHCRGAL